MEDCRLEGERLPGGSAGDSQVFGGPSRPQTVLGTSYAHQVKGEFGHRQQAHF